MTRPQSLLISNHPLRCPHCSRFTVRRAQLAAARIDSRSAEPVDVYVCTACGRIQAFLATEPALSTPEKRGRERFWAEAREALAARRRSPAGRKAVRATRTG